MISTFQKKLLLILFGIALILLFLDFSFKQNNTLPIKLIEPSETEIDSIFKSALFAFNIDSTFIKKNKIKKNENYSYSYSVTLPSDVPIPLIIKELQSLLIDYVCSLNSVETKINTSGFIKIIADNNAILYSDFLVNKKLTRKGGNLVMLFTELEEASEDELNEILLSTENISFILPSLTKSREVAGKIKKNNKDVVYLLLGEDADLDYRIKSEYSEKRLRISLSNILTHFPHKFYYIEREKIKKKNAGYKYLVENLNKRKIELHFTDELIIYDKSNYPDFAAFLKPFESSLLNNQTFLIATSYKNYSECLQEMKKMRKLGIKISFASSIIEQMRIVN